MSPKYDFNRRIRCCEVNGAAEVTIVEYVPFPGFTFEQLIDAPANAFYRTEDGHEAVYLTGEKAFKVAALGKLYRPVGPFSPL